jgi:hypothetical protein
LSWKDGIHLFKQEKQVLFPLTVDAQLNIVVRELSHRCHFSKSEGMVTLDATTVHEWPGIVIVTEGMSVSHAYVNYTINAIEKSNYFLVSRIFMIIGNKLPL